MKKQTFINQVIIACLLVFTACQTTGDFETKETTQHKTSKARIVKKKKVLLLGIDGLQWEKIHGVSTPNIDKFNMVKAYTGGIKGTSSEQKTNSGPGWTTMLTGVWANKHRVLDNSSSYKLNVKSVFQILKEHNPNLETTSVITWKTIHDFLRDQMKYVDFKHAEYGDDKAVNNALFEINNHNPDFLFIDIDEPDAVGHASGFGSLYNDAVRRADTRVGTIVKAIEKRANEKNEDWLIILSTDHGRQSNGYNHGGQSGTEKTIFIGLNRAGNEEFTSVDASVPNKDYGGLYGYVSHTSLVPTILTHLEIPIKREWELCSTSLIGNVGPRKVMMKNKNTIYWSAGASGTIEVYRNKQYLASVNASQGSFVDNNQPDGDLTYTLVLNGQTASVTIKNINVIAGLDWNDSINNKAYFFRGNGEYMRYNKALDKVDAGYPIMVTNGNWPGLEVFRNKITASFNWNNSTCFFFLNDGTYINYNMNTDRANSGAREITNSNWPGLALYKNKIIAAFQWNSKKAYIFLNDGTYVRYNITNDRVDSGYPKPVNNSTWPGMAGYGTKITAAVNWNSVHCYFFLNDGTYLKYSKVLDRVEVGYPKPINNATWPGFEK
ncbi:Metalloenzyme domain-containing protein [Tenacibaculum sp. 190524A02b]|uniref:Metalloenzyme domain-containing protein n=1 Tax=Tenacibaculum vairaonense TaxID=3137860 RepID=A0ABM9PGT5_9FLAO